MGASNSSVFTLPEFPSCHGGIPPQEHVEIVVPDVDELVGCCYSAQQGIAFEEIVIESEAEAEEEKPGGGSTLCETETGENSALSESGAEDLTCQEELSKELAEKFGCGEDYKSKTETDNFEKRAKMGDITICTDEASTKGVCCVVVSFPVFAGKFGDGLTAAKLQEHDRRMAMEQFEEQDEDLYCGGELITTRSEDSSSSDSSSSSSSSSSSGSSSSSSEGNGDRHVGKVQYIAGDAPESSRLPTIHEEEELAALNIEELQTLVALLAKEEWHKQA